MIQQSHEQLAQKRAARWLKRNGESLAVPPRHIQRALGIEKPVPYRPKQAKRIRLRRKVVLAQTEASAIVGCMTNWQRSRYSAALAKVTKTSPGLRQSVEFADKYLRMVRHV